MNDQAADTGACEACSEDGSSFAPGARWTITGTLTVDSAAAVLESSGDAKLPETGVVSLRGVHAVDSAAVAVLLSWRRRAALEGKTLTFVDPPASLLALAQLYGVEDLLRQAGQ
ncbi:MAG: STAS domain-containing protein [Betaproteobacteria bacterium]|nr:MAG: STAS domain-containing protein [Betaproteobacteria bacterium]